MPRIIQFYEWNVKLKDFLIIYDIYTHTPSYQINYDTIIDE